MPGVPPSLNATGEDSATPQGASLRKVPIPPFHVSVSVSGAGVPDTRCVVAPTMAKVAPITAMLVRMQRVASLPRVLHLAPILCAKRPKVVPHHAAEMPRRPGY